MRLERDERKRGRSKKEGRTQKKMWEGKAKGKETDNLGHCNHSLGNQGGWLIFEIWPSTIRRINTHKCYR